MKCTITLTGNAGVICRCEETVFMVDALHNTPEAYWPWGSFTEKQLEELHALYRECRPAAFLFTHRHGDHFTETLAEKAMAEYTAPIYFPGTADKKRGERKTDSVEMEWMELPHEKEEIHGRENYGFFLSVKGKNFLFAGDCTPGDPRISELIMDRPVDVAVLNLNWIGLRNGRRAVQERIRPKHIALVHFPRAEFDHMGYYQAVSQLSARFFPEMDIRPMRDYLQTEVFEL